MAKNSAIEWTDHTFNPWEGCTKISPACDNCYAAERAARYKTVEGGVLEVSESPCEKPCSLVIRYGKKRAGRLLDGIEHTNFPTSEDITFSLSGSFKSFRKALKEAEHGQTK